MYNKNNDLIKATTKTPSLQETHPEIAAEWDYERNGSLKPNMVSAGSHRLAHWKCPKGPDHEWATAIRHRARRGHGCSICANRIVVPSNCLAKTHPNIAKEFYTPMNGVETSLTISAGSNKYFYWKCAQGDDHIWKTSPQKRTLFNSPCPYCNNTKVSTTNSLASNYPHIAAEWDYQKNGELTPDLITTKNMKSVFWQCTKNAEHRWQTSTYNRTKNKSGCPYCSNKKAHAMNCLATTHPSLAKEMHPTKNGSITAYNISKGSDVKVIWVCSINPAHDWEASPSNRTKREPTGCPYCSNHKINTTNSLATKFPNIASELSDNKNGNVNAHNVSPGSGENLWWACSMGHEWQAVVRNRTKPKGTGCPSCYKLAKTIKFKEILISIQDHLHILSNAALYVLFQQGGLDPTKNKINKLLFTNLNQGEYTKEQLDAFIKDNKSSIEDLIEGNNLTSYEEDEDELSVLSSETILSEDDHEVDNKLHLEAETRDILKSLDNKIFINADHEAMEFIVKEAIMKIWNNAFNDIECTLQQLKDDRSDGVYTLEVKNRFLDEYQKTINICFPPWSFNHPPNLMQKHISYLVNEHKRIGNWSAPGTGKTLSAILASRVANAQFTIIFCPNNVIDNWKENLNTSYPDCLVHIKDIYKIPKFKTAPVYVILNYEYLQQVNSEAKLRRLLKEHVPDFIIIDEVHFSKQRIVENLSRRKRVLSAFLSNVSYLNRDLHILGMSATPIINNLFEGKTMLELVTGDYHDDIQTKTTVSNCISLYQKFINYGIRWIPRHPPYLLQLHIEDIDCSWNIDAIRKQVFEGNVADIEAEFIKAKLPYILQSLKPKTIIYTHYIKNILINIQEEVTRKGWKVALFTGDNKNGLTDFIHGNADVLIASSCISTGIDKLQHVSNRMIIASLPWTHAEFKQLESRIARQGQKQNIVDIIIPLTYFEKNGVKHSWCRVKRWDRINIKKVISVAALDGDIPEGHLRSPAQAVDDLKKWFERIEAEGVYEIERRSIFIPLESEINPIIRRKCGNLVQMNTRLYKSKSHNSFKRFQENPNEWGYYHAILNEERKKWVVDPLKEAIKWFKSRSTSLIIGDFGCGEAFLSASLENTVISFDYVAVNDNVIACDMRKTGLDDESLDAAVFCLSLMGVNFVEYLLEGHRCLKLDGQLWIAEPTSRIKNIEIFKDLLFKMGFDIRDVSLKGKFTFIKAIKSERECNIEAIESFKPKHYLE